MVDVRVRRGGVAAARFDLLLVPVTEGGLAAAVAGVRGNIRAALARRARAAKFRGRPDEVLVHHGDAATALVGLGPAPAGSDAWRRAGARGRQEAERQRARRVAVLVPGGVAPDAIEGFVEGFQLAGYRFAGYASDADERRPHVEGLTIAGDGLSP